MIYDQYKIYARQWTLEAIRCYQSGCNCSKCETIQHVESINKKTCKMKRNVIELVRRFGVPDENTIMRLRSERENEEWAT